MHTIIADQHCETRSISIDLAPEKLHAYLAEPQNIPAWAPKFASAIRADGESWVITTATGEGRIVVEVAAQAGTVDIVALADRRRGAFMRVIPNSEGSELLFTLLFAPGTSEDAVNAQMATVEEELATVRRLVAAECN